MSANSFSKLTANDKIENVSHEFEITVEQLSALFLPSKNMEALASLGGVSALCAALKVNPKFGILNIDHELNHDGKSFIGKEATLTVLENSIKPKPQVIAESSSIDRMADSMGSTLPLVQLNETLAVAENETQNIESAAIEMFISQTSASADHLARVRAFGENRTPKAKVKTIFDLIFIAMKDKMLILLTIAGVVSTVVGILRASGIIGAEESADTEKNENPEKFAWVEGLGILVAVVFVIWLQAGNDWKRERQFQSLNAQKEDIKVTVMREEGKIMKISIYSLLVGDILILQPGDILPCDAVFIEGHSLKCDESGSTGESDYIKKGIGHDLLFLSGSKVVEGTGRCLVTAVGVNSFHGKTIMSLQHVTETTPLQEQLNNLAEKIAKIGGISALVLLICLSIRLGIYAKLDNYSSNKILTKILEIFTNTVAVIVVAVPEGLPLAVSLSLSFATKKLLKQNNLVRVLASCEVMANATTICSDKTGTLTQNKMAVVRGCFGGVTKKIEKIDDAINLRQIINDENFFQILNNSLALNSTAFQEIDEITNKLVFSGSKTETALLEMQRCSGIDCNILREQNTIFHVFPFSSLNKWMGTIINITLENGNPGYRVFVKGASEVVLALSFYLYSLDEGGIIKPMAGSLREVFDDKIDKYAQESLRTICTAYRDFEKLPIGFEDNVGLVVGELTLVALFGIEDPLRAGVTEAVASCQRAGVFVRMVTGDNIITAKAIATQAGILQKGGIVMEGQQFRRLPKVEMEKILPRLQVLARSSPMDKQMLVENLQKMGNVVAVTGDGTNDAPALSLADVGFSMGIAGTQVAKDASKIIIMDDNFASIVNAILWGRNVNDSVKQFLQFQLTVNIAAVIINFIVNFVEGFHVLTVVQMLWVNMIMDSLAALAFATEPPNPKLLLRRPLRRDAPLITYRMWRIIISGAIAQISMLLGLVFLSKYIFPLGLEDHNSKKNLNELENPKKFDVDSKEFKNIISSIAFNSFIFFQIFNEINCRILDKRLNVFEGLHRNIWFISIILGTIIAQAIIINFLGAAFHVVSLDLKMWGISIGIGFLALPLGLIIRIIPDLMFPCCPPPKRPVEQLFISKERMQWYSAISKVQTQLSVFRALRGDRVLGPLPRSTTSIRSGVIGSNPQL